MPFYADQLAILGYWQQIGGLTMLPGTNRAPDRFVRASFYINAVVQSADPKVAVPAVMSVMRNVSVPYGISTPDKPHIASTRWRTVCDQKNRVYYFEPTLAMETFWVDLAAIDFFEGQRRAHPHACRRADLRGRRHGEIPQERQAFRVPLRGVISSVRNEKPRL